MRPRVLLAGVGNVLLGDDGFGVEVVQRLEGTVLPSWVQIADYGIGCGRLDRLLGGYDTTILIDATPRGGRPGEVYVMEAELDEHPSCIPALLDPHGIRPEGALRLLQVLGGDAGRVLVVGCEPIKRTGIGLSSPVTAAVAEAVRVVTDLVWGTDPRRPVTSVEPETPRQLEAMGGE
ncbi:peptidase M52 [Prauserella sp. PE36]|uniref:Hydrogenase maturation protease n=1 Tax=Prauserella endophytica TaxID=1592324 RepID=A0ABY2S1Q7_9PSEU|nr:MULTISPECIES: hydrogenase maturation protease [Prauserella]PXY24924.1 peptidase M52 [Prauserella coralliicola]RBM16930.1 peptidase M52 [Prauserella sp. PE36]TKG66681.1 hydrogenase maturation protease [Prauserella endophytica]